MPGFPVAGSNSVERGYPKYLPPGEAEPGTGEPLADGRIYINETQYFEGVLPEVWAFHIGGYQVCEKWIKDRRGHTLGFDDLQHYQETTVALRETIQLMAEIDVVIDRHGGWPSAFTS